MGIKVLVSETGDKTKNVNYALRKLKRLCVINGVPQKIREKAFYTKSSEVKRLKKKQKIYNAKNNIKEKENESTLLYSQ